MSVVHFGPNLAMGEFIGAFASKLRRHTTAEKLKRSKPQSSHPPFGRARPTEDSIDAARASPVENHRGVPAARSGQCYPFSLLLQTLEAPVEPKLISPAYPFLRRERGASV